MSIGAMYIGTIHSYCHEILGRIDARYRQFEVLDENRLKLYLISRYYELGLQRLQGARGSKYFETVKEVAEAWTVLNDELIDIETVTAHDAVLGEIFTSIREHLQRDQFIDFSQMVRLAVDALRSRDAGALEAVSKLRHLMVDEYQDINPSQEALIRELHDHSESLFAVGDDDQSIYGWRGADVSQILSFQERYPQCSAHTLSLNFRSTEPIVGRKRLHPRRAWCIPHTKKSDGTAVERTKRLPGAVVR